MQQKQAILTKNERYGMSIAIVLALLASFYLYHSRLDVVIHDIAVHWGGTDMQHFWGYLSRMGQDWFQILVSALIGVYYYKQCNYRMSRLWYGSIVVYLATGLLVQVVKFFIGRPRPKMFPEYDPIWFETAARYHSWPSGHTITTFAWLACLLPFYPRKIQIFLTVTACFVGYSRVGLGSHYMSDVLSGAVLGYVIGTLLCRKFKLGVKV